MLCRVQTFKHGWIIARISLLFKARRLANTVTVRQENPAGVMVLAGWLAALCLLYCPCPVPCVLTSRTALLPATGGGARAYDGHGRA